MNGRTIPPPPMNVQDFVDAYIKQVPYYEVSAEDQKKIQFQGIENLIYEKLTSAKFRSAKIPPELQQKVQEKIHLCVTNNLPIHITVPFGGYKKWQFKTAPHIDFSEVFNLLQLREYLAPIAALYSKGVFLEYFSDEIFVSAMNNIPQEDVDLYNNEFTELISYLKPYFPQNFQCKYSKIRDFISQEEIFKRFEEIKKDLRIKWKTLPQEEQKRRLDKARRNYKGEGIDDKIIFEANLIHDAFLFGDWDPDIPWAFDKHMIAVGFRYTKTWGIPLMSTRSSTPQFWVATGMLYKKEDTYVPSSLTYEQYLEHKTDLQEIPLLLFPKTFPQLQSMPTLTFSN